MSILFTFFLLFFVISSCDLVQQKEINFHQLDSLIEKGSYQQALSIINNAGATEDSLTTLKLEYRRDRILRWRVFDPLIQRVLRGDTTGVRARCRAITDSVKRFIPARLRWYLAEQHQIEAVLDSLNGNRKGWFNHLDALLKLPSDDINGRMKTAFRLAWYFAEIDSMVTARSYLDKALRGLPKKHLTPAMIDIYTAYMNGVYDSARVRLNRLPEDSLSTYWLQTRRFLNRYGKRLTMKDRFKLW